MNGTIAQSRSRFSISRFLSQGVTLPVQLAGGAWLIGMAASIMLGGADDAARPTCMFKYFSGCPCPTCGSTRSVLRLFHGDIAGALAFNPLVTACLFAAPILFARAMIFGTRTIDCSATEHRRRTTALWTIATLALLANWIFVIWRGN